MKLKKEGEFTVFSTTEISPAPRFDAFSFVSKDSLSAWNELDTNVWNSPHSSSGALNISSQNSFAQPEPTLAQFNGSFMDEVSSNLEGLAFVEKSDSQIWSSSFDSLDSLGSNNSSPSMKKKKKQPETPSPPEEDKTVIEEELSRQNLYKTELCRSFGETGVCRYGHKCQFAHGTHEVRPVMRHPKYKTEVCKKFATTGSCPYGVRCRFIHPTASHDTNISSPPGSPSPQPSIVWSNTWSTPSVVEEKKSSAMKKAPGAIGSHIKDSPETARRLAFFQSIA